jgi:hypothetical protein
MSSIVMVLTKSILDSIYEAGLELNPLYCGQLVE